MKSAASVNTRRKVSAGLLTDDPARPHLVHRARCFWRSLDEGADKMSIIHTTRFDSDRERRAKLAQEYRDGMRELNAPPPDMEQLPQTRGPDPIGEDLRFIMLGLCAGLVVCLVLTGWKFWPAVEAALGVVR